MFKRLVLLPRRLKILIMLCCDVILLPAAFWTAIALRLGTMDPDVSPYWLLFPVIVVTTIPIFIKLGLYRAVIRFVDEKIIYTILTGVSLSVLILAASVTFWRFDYVPRSAIMMYWFMATTYITTSRYLARGLIRKLEPLHDKRTKVAIYGAGRAGLQTALALISSKEYSPVAFFDDNPQLNKTMVAGIRVYGPDDIFKVLGKHQISEVLLALPSISRARRKEIIQNFEGQNVNLKTIPSFQELITGNVRIEDIREVGIEDLLGRDIVPPDENLIKACVTGKNVLVTGAGGSIGSELCRQIAKQGPKKLVLFEINEFALYRIHQELSRLFPHLKIKTVLASVLDSAKIDHVLKSEEIQTVYHAAAYKHVPLVEENVSFGVYNNVFGTWNFARLAVQNEIQNFVLISTDKAVRPTNVMGASKRFAELVVQMLSHKEGVKTKLSMVRFGNVLGSSGSVIPLFKEQIKNGGPVTVTHPDVIRYFMTIPEAAQLVMQAGSMATQGDVFVLDMGEPVKILELAQKMIRLSGFELYNRETGEGDIAIEFIGLRPGEKLFEELLIGENAFSTSHPRILRAQEKYFDEKFMLEKLKALESAYQKHEDSVIVDLLRQIVPEYKVSDLHNG